MQYEEIRHKIKSGDVLAWTHRSWNSLSDIKLQFIRIFTRSEYIHTGTAWVVCGRIFVIEASPKYIKITPLSHSKEFFWININKDWSLAEEFAIGLVGRGEYSYKEAISSLNKETPEDSGQWFCSKLTNSILKRMGLDLDLKNQTPSNLINALLDKGFTLTKVKV